MTIEKYLDKPQMIGFMESFPIKEILFTAKATSKIRNIPIKFNIHVAKLGFGDNLEYHVLGIVTDTMTYLLPKRFGSISYFDEARIMKIAVAKLASCNNYTICQDICSWPFAKVLIQENNVK